MKNEILSNIFDKAYEKLELKKLIKEELLKGVNAKEDSATFGKIITKDGKQYVWRTNKWGNHYLQEVESRNGLYYIKGTDQMYMQSAEYHTVMEKLKPQNLNKQQLESKEFIIEIDGFMYTVKNTDSGCVVIDKQKRGNNGSN